MIANIRPGYVNPLTTQSKPNPSNPLQNLQKDKEDGGVKTQSATDKQKSLETEKLMLESSLLLIKGTSGEAGVPQEVLEKFEVKIKEISMAIKTSKTEVITENSSESVATVGNKHKFDRVEISNDAREKYMQEYPKKEDLLLNKDDNNWV